MTISDLRDKIFALPYTYLHGGEPRTSDVLGEILMEIVNRLEQIEKEKVQCGEGGNI